MQQTNRFNRIAAALNVLPDEIRPAALLWSLSFCIGGAVVFGLTATNALLLAEWGAEYLPYIYILSALIIATTGVVFSKLEQRLAIGSLLIATFSLLVLSGCALQLTLWLTTSRWVVFVAPIWYEFVYALTALTFWALASRFFNLAQGKRLFGLVSSGEVASRIVGYALVSVLAQQLGARNLVSIAIVSLGLGWLVLMFGMRQLAWQDVEAVHPAPKQDTARPAHAWQMSRYLWLVLSASLLALIGYYFVEFVFFVAVEERFVEADRIAAFIGLFAGVVFLVSFVISTLFSSRLLQRYGVKWSLLVRVIAVMAGMAAVALTGMIGAAIGAIFSLIIVTKFFDDILDKALHRPASQLLFQPLPTHERLFAQTVAHTIVAPLSLGVVGGLLLLFRFTGTLNYVYLASGLVLLIGVWIGLTLLVYREYLVALTRALRKRRLDGATIDLVDRSSVDLVQHALGSSFPGEVIYALTLLEQTNPTSFETGVPSLLAHPAPDVRQYALDRIERLTLTSARDTVRVHIPDETVASIRAAALRALAAVGEPEDLDRIRAYLADPDPALRRAALVGLLRYGGIEGALAGGHTLMSMVTASDPAERALAARVLGDVGVRSFYQPLEHLLHDHDSQVRRAALQAAGKMKHPKLWPLVIHALADPAVRAMAGYALVTGDHEAMPAIEAAFHEDQTADVMMRLARVCGKIGGARAVHLLESKINESDAEVRTEIFAALTATSYQATGPAAAQVHQQIKREAAAAAWLLQAQVDLGDGDELALVVRAVTSQFERSRDRMLLLLALLYDGRTMLQARDALASHVASQRAYALEVIDTRLSQKLKDFVLPLLHDLSVGQRLQRLSAAFPQTKLERDERLRSLISEPAAQPFTWIIACAIYTVGRLGLRSCLDEVRAARHAAAPVVRATAHWAYVHLDGAATTPLEQHEGANAMFSTLERVLILKSVHIFADTPDDILAGVATILEEVDVPAGETIFQEGELGSSMYLIARGSVRVHDGTHTLNNLGERDVFGEMALLDPEPRVASVTALEDTLLFRLDQEPFYELMADRVEVVRGIFRVLTSYVRARVHDVAMLQSRVAELERVVEAQPGSSGDGRVLREKLA
jgi:HEAT repeat protein/ATP/ADP translocase